MASANSNLKKYGNTKVDLLSEEQQNVLRSKGNITQLSKPLLQSEGSLNWSKHVTPATLSIFHDEKSWSGIQTIELKKKTNVKEFKDSYGLSWHQVRDAMHLESETESASEIGSPVTTRLDVKDMDIFGAMPLEEEFVVVKCKNCQRPILPSKFKEHSESCIGATFTDDDEEEEPDTRKKLIKNMKKKATALEDELNIPSTTAKRPPTVLIEKPDKKKMKKEKQKKTTKQKAPLDLDKQCGVIQGQNNLPCTRSLTCKSHSMGAKRAVEGRSQKYDVLLQAYQKKSIGRPNAPASSIAASTGFNSNGTISGGKSIKNLKRLQGQQISPSVNGNNGSNSSGIKSNLASTQLNEEPFVDSDEEVENVMQALKLSRPTPLAQKPFFFVKRRRQCFRLRDVLLDSITPKSATTNDSHIPSLPVVDNRHTDYARQQQQYQQQQYQQQQYQQQQQQQQQMFSGMVIDNNTLYGETPNNINASFS
ncbi:SCA7-domain-containing protein, partial [Mucor ambiguus]